MLSVNYAECQKQTHCAECHYAECNHAECHGAKNCLILKHFQWQKAVYY
jgi:hypothetical protein